MVRRRYLPALERCAGPLHHLRRPQRPQQDCDSIGVGVRKTKPPLGPHPIQVVGHTRRRPNARAQRHAKPPNRRAHSLHALPKAAGLPSQRSGPPNSLYCRCLSRIRDPRKLGLRFLRLPGGLLASGSRSLDGDPIGSPAGFLVERVSKLRFPVQAGTDRFLRAS